MSETETRSQSGCAYSDSQPPLGGITMVFKSLFKAVFKSLFKEFVFVRVGLNSLNSQTRTFLVWLFKPLFKPRLKQGLPAEFESGWPNADEKRVVKQRHARHGGFTRSNFSFVSLSQLVFPPVALLSLVQSRLFYHFRYRKILLPYDRHSHVHMSRLVYSSYCLFCCAIGKLPKCRSCRQLFKQALKQGCSSGVSQLQLV